MNENDMTGAEVEMIRASAAAVAPAGNDLSRIRALRFTPVGFDPDTYRRMGELGWLALRLPGSVGGLQLGMRPYCALAEMLGRGLVPEPLIDGVLAARLLGSNVDSEQLAGARIVLPAWQEGAESVPGAPVATRLASRRLNGVKTFVHGARGADAFAVLADAGAVLADCTAEGLSIAAEGLQDGCHAAALSFRATPASGAAEQIDAGFALDEACLATAAYLLGVADRAFEITLDYLRVRHQFDRPIGSFQALQHRAADMKIQIELTRASIDAAAGAFDDATAARRAARVSQAKVRAADTVMLVTREAIQMHGAIGFTDEHDIGLYLRKAMVLANRFGSARMHRRRFDAWLTGAHADAAEEAA